jgi:hypothetical protein
LYIRVLEKMSSEFFEVMCFKCPERKGVADFLQEVSDPAESRLLHVGTLNFQLTLFSEITDYI